MTRRALKYRNKPTMVDGIRFASKAEAKRWGELLLLERAGKIESLYRQPRYPLMFRAGKPVATYIADFAYEERDGETWRRVTEDVKGVETPAFKLKAKMFAACYPNIELRIIRT